MAKPPGSTTNVETPAALGVVIALFCFAALPLMLVDNLQFIDFPEHLAAFHTLYKLSDSNHLQAYYTIREGLFPYWGIRATMSVLVPVFGIEEALRAFAVLAMLMPAAGACALGQVLGRQVILVALVSLAFVYNDVLHWGFLNFLFSAGIAMFCFALWVANREHPAALRLALLAVAAVVLIWMHPLASCVLGLMIGLWETADWIQSAREYEHARRFGFIVLVCLCFVPALASLILLTNFDSNAGGYLHLGHLSDRLWIAFSPFWLGMGSIFNLALGLAGLACAGLMMITGMLKLAPGIPRFVIYFLIAAYAAPFVVFGVFYVNLRLPLFACLCFVAGLQLTETGKRRKAALFGIFAVVLAGKLVASGLVLAEGSKRVSELREATQTISEGARVLQVIDRTAPDYPGMLAEADYQNLGSYLIVDRDAYVPDIFGSVAIAYTDAVASQAAPMTIPPGFSLLETPVADWSVQDRIFARHAAEWRTNYDYLLVIDFGARRDPPAGTKTLVNGSYFKILKVNG